MAADIQLTEPPWEWDGADSIYTVNGRTLVATLHRGAHGNLLAAAPQLLQALEGSLRAVDEQQSKLRAGKLPILAEETLREAPIAIARATGRYPASLSPQDRLWTVNPKLSPDEQEATIHLLATARELWGLATKAFQVLAVHGGDSVIVAALVAALGKADYRDSASAEDINIEIPR